MNEDLTKSSKEAKSSLRPLSERDQRIKKILTDTREIFAGSRETRFAFQDEILQRYNYLKSKYSDYADRTSLHVLIDSGLPASYPQAIEDDFPGEDSVEKFVNYLAEKYGKQPEVSTAEKNEKKVARILLADDDEKYTRRYKTIFEGLGYKVETVENGYLLLDRLETGEYDLVMTDNQMPAMTGLEALQQIRATEKTKNLPVIVFSGDSIKKEVEALGGVHLMKGQTQRPEILATVARMLEDAK